MKKMKRMTAVALPYIVIALMLVIAFIPILWVVLSSVKPAGDILATPPLYFPKVVTFQHYYDIFFKSNVLPYFRNSLIIATAATLVSLFIGTMAAYVFARSKSKFLDLLLSAILTGRMMPAVALVIPLYMAIRKMGLVNTRLSLIISYTAICLPFAIFMMIGFIQQIPAASRSDGGLCALYSNGQRTGGSDERESEAEYR